MTSFAPVAMTSVSQTRQPRIRRVGNVVKICHREPIGLVTTRATPGVALQEVRLNPGDSGSFPWLSQECAGFDEYRFTKLRIEYVTRCATTQLGRVVIGIDYNAADPPPLTIQQAETFVDSVDTATWQNAFTDFNVDRMHPNGRKKYIRHMSFEPNSNLQNTDVGFMFVLTDAVSSPQINCGEVYANYEVELSAENSQTIISQAQGSLVYNRLNNSYVSSYNAGSVNVPGGTTAFVNLPLGVAYGQPQSLNFVSGTPAVISGLPPGPALVSFRATCAATNNLNARGAFQITDAVGGVVLNEYFTITGSNYAVNTSCWAQTLWEVDPASIFTLSAFQQNAAESAFTVSNFEVQILYITQN